MRQCTTCKVEYPLTEFYKSKLKGQKKLKVAATCKQCSIIATNENQRLKKEYYAAWYKEYIARPEVQERLKAYRQDERTKKLKREHYHFWKTDPVKVAAKRARQREAYRLKKLNEAKVNERTN